ncbi:conserved exported hypothetical protein [Agrobacterium deltaense NCPPB 1641]|uniref:Uncharacterized protein n=1 Tax=Agrobacterium deltaense NCPPB 1641 TaxID=1183425 RepID=A0A1S7TS06_9HYPH|nr:conserved exported hypothetical protein [Agrobacterium deltaense NCPPB 1641]
MLKRLTIVIVMILVSPIFGGAIYRYACWNRLTDADVFQATKMAYWDSLNIQEKTELRNESSVKCGPPHQVRDDFYGVSVGLAWSVFCAGVVDGLVVTSESFRINKCYRTRY